MFEIMNNTNKYSSLLSNLTKENVSGFDNNFIKFVFKGETNTIIKVDILEGIVSVIESKNNDEATAITNYNYEMFRVAGLVNIHSSYEGNVVTSTNETDNFKNAITDALNYFKENYENILNGEFNDIFEEFYSNKSIEELRSNGIYLNKIGEMISLGSREIPKLNLSEPTRLDLDLISEAKGNRNEIKLFGNFKKQFKSSTFNKKNKLLNKNK